LVKIYFHAKSDPIRQKIAENISRRIRSGSMPIKEVKGLPKEVIERAINGSSDLQEHPEVFAEMIEDLARNYNLPAKFFAHYISRSVSKSRKVVDQPESGHNEEAEQTVKGMALYHEVGYSMDPSASVFQSGYTQTIGQKWVVDIPEQSHFDYGESDIKKANELLKMHDSQKQREILSELNRINPELAKFL
jgi:hypothetical protein